MRRHNKKPSDEIVAQARRLHAEGMTAPEISLVVGYSSNSVWRMLDPARAEHYRKKASQNYHELVAMIGVTKERRKLAPGDVETIQKRGAAGESIKSLAIAYKLSPQYVGSILNGKRPRSQPENTGV